MPSFKKITTMQITKDDRAWLSFGNYVLAQIKAKMEEENAEYLENIYTGEIVEIEDIKKAFYTIDSLVDTQESWGWKLV